MACIIKKCETKDSLKFVVNEAVSEIGGFGKFVKKGESVLLKINVNTADPFPASSDPFFIKVVTELILENGASKVIIGDSSTFYQNTKRNFQKLKLFDLENIDPRVSLISFDEGEWIRKEINGKCLKFISIPEVLGSVDKMIFLPCLKTHFIAEFTGALKLGIGLMKPTERLALHAKDIEQKIAESNLAFRPDLIIMDGRKCFITKGPSEGDVREPNLILASDNRVEIDVEGVKIIKSFFGNDLEKFEAEEIPQIKKAIELGIK